MTPLEEREDLAAGADASRRGTMLRKYQGARISVSGGTDISGASTRRRRRPGGGGGGGGGGATA